MLVQMLRPAKGIGNLVQKPLSCQMLMSGVPPLHPGRQL